MAIDDVISDWDQDISATSYFSLQPASGVEWLITKCYTVETVVSESMLRPLTSDVNLVTQYPGIATATGGAGDVALFSLAPRRWFMTNGNYARIYNASSSTHQLAFSGLQTK